MPIVPLDYADLLLYAESNIDLAKRARAAVKEPETVAWIEGMADDEVLWDVGANVGPYTLIAASRGVTVVAFEPAWFNIASLHRNLILNSAHDVIVCPFALGRRNGIQRVKWSSMESGAAEHSWGDGQPVTMFRADTLVTYMDTLPLPDHVKIDVDGGELDVLEGALGVLSMARSVLVELDDANPRSAQVDEFMTECGFTCTGKHRHGTGNIQNAIYRVE